MENIKQILSEINIPEAAQKVYITLLEEGEATARTLSHRTGITRPSVYDQIKILRSKGLVSERFVEGTTFFTVGDARNLSILLNDQIEKLNSQKNFLIKNIDSLIKKSGSVQPKIRFFEGQEGVKQLLKDILWYENITLYLYWPYEHMLNMLGEDFLLWFRQKRKVRNIPIKTIWNHNIKSKKESSIFGDSKDVERRYLNQKKRPLHELYYLRYKSGFYQFTQRIIWLYRRKRRIH